ncbi:MAG: YifB family Mg chelatase-like AAA ATPase [Candidatus Eremiobacteraeota bacterium]|nr:YifB family Mg chelatase-like AAA ATPase [Candidatus Eremiobacteraeota bacterium]MBC5827448.1 YifB family Mg chelatase-like AAA ATPase [Candidatus Eremiobacteraeota bacterium]
MLAIGYSAALRGIDAYVVRVEVVGVPTADAGIHIVGLADRSVQESKERVNAAVRSCGFLFPTYKVVVNLAPANVRKEGAAFDVALALSVLAMDGQIDAKRLADVVAVGELALDGAVKAVGGVLPIAIGMKDAGFCKLILPAENLAEAALVGGLRLYPIRTLQQAVQVALGQADASVASVNDPLAVPESIRYPEDLEDVRGQERVKRAMEVAAAGGHNVLMVGAPGSGKTMLARRMPSILPSMAAEEALEVTKLYSVSGLLAQKSRLVTARPFRAPHHTVSANALVGGGAVPRPGEVSLAHCGVLFLDELPEFPRSTLEVLRQPLEDACVTVSRTAGTVTYPANFMLVASLNPCPCGYHGDKLRGCTCSPPAIRRYLSKLSGPLLDRIDMHVEVPRLPYEDMARHSPAESSTAVRQRVETARRRQWRRFRGGGCNAAMPAKQLREICALEGSGRALLGAAVAKMQLSARAHDRILRVARTIADLGDAESIGTAHLAEAIGYRSLDRSLWSAQTA